MRIPSFLSRPDYQLRARIRSERPLRFEGAPSLSAPDRPPFVGAASGLTWTGQRLVVVADRSDYVAVLEGASAPALALSMRSPSSARPQPGAPREPPLCLEALVAARDWRGEFVLAFGSGLGAEQQRVARLRLEGGNTELSLFPTATLYRALEDLEGFATSELNLAGAALLPRGLDGRDGVRLFHRGNRPARPGRREDQHYSSTIDLRIDSLLAYLDRVKRDPAAFLGFDLLSPRRYDLDDYGGGAFTFTDAASFPDAPERTAYVAVAEGPDGEVLATAFGIIEANGEARYTVLAEKDGELCRRRAEGMVLSSPRHGHLVVQDPEGGPATLVNFDLAGL